jgi:hypothetical protein
MKAITLAIVICCAAFDVATTKPYSFPDQGLQFSISNDWQTETDSDELVGFSDANNDTFSIVVIPTDKPYEVQHSDLGANIKKDLTGKGFEVLKDGQFQFAGQPTIYLIAKKVKLGFQIFVYEILVRPGKDVLDFTMVGDSDPSQAPQFKSILGSVIFKAPSSTKSVDASSATTATSPSK